jgi:CheY-like chemotaxis protein
MEPNVPAEQPADRPDALIVDDHNDALLSMRELLTILGFNVVAAGSGAVALAKAAERPPEVALLDICMPIMNGYEVASRLRQLPGMDRALLVAVTGSVDEEFVARARAAGFNGFLSKPIDMNLLEQILRNRALTASDPFSDLGPAAPPARRPPSGRAPS